MSARDDATFSRASTIAGYAVAFWSVLYLLPHLVWALGVRAGFVALHPSIATFPQWRTINWIASGILGIAALLGLALRRRSPNTAVHRAKLTIAWFGACIATAHGLVGIGMRIETICGWPQPAVPAWLYWDLLVFEPWFLIEGVLLAVAGSMLLSSSSQRNRWALLYIAGTAVAIIFALLRVKMW
jgi:hypothetical protein